MRLSDEFTTDFSLGMSDSVAATQFRPNEVRQITNGRVEPDGTIRRRSGTRRKHATTLGSGTGYGAYWFKTAAGADQLLAFVGNDVYKSNGSTNDTWVALLLEGLHVDGNLAISATADRFKTTAQATYIIAGVSYNKAATDNLEFSNADTIGASQFGIWLVQINAAGTISTKSPSAAMTYTTAALALAALPEPDAGNVALGRIAVAAGVGGFTANTTALTSIATFTDADLVVTLREDYYDFASMRVGDDVFMFAANGADHILRWDGTSLDTLPNAPEGVKFVEQFNGRLYAAGHDGVIVQASRIADPETWSSDFGLTVQAITHHAGGITGLYQIGPHLLVFDRESTSYIDGFGDSSIIVASGATGFSRSVGCIGFRTIVGVGDNAVCWQSGRGVEHYSPGTGIRLLSRRVQRFLEEVDSASATRDPGLHSAVYDPVRQEYHIALSRTGSRNDRTLVVNILNDPIDKIGMRAACAIDSPLTSAAGDNADAIVHSIGSAVGRDFATIGDWEVATRGLVGDGRIYVGECYDDSDFDEFVHISGGSTTPTSYRVLSVASSARHDGTAGSGARINYTGAWGGTDELVEVFEAYSRVEWLEVTATTAATGAAVGIRLMGASTRADLSIVHDLDGSTSLAAIVAGQGVGGPAALGQVVSRNIVYGTPAAGIHVFAVGGVNSALSNTVYGCVGHGIVSDPNSGGAPHIANNVSAENGGSDFSWGAGSETSSNNASSDATADDAGGNGHLISQAAGDLDFVNVGVGTEDFHIAATSTLVGAGTDLGTDYDTDIDGGAVSGDWDIGADQEDATAPPAATVPSADSLPATLFLGPNSTVGPSPLVHSLGYDGFVRVHHDADQDDMAPEGAAANAAAADVTMTVITRPFLFRRPRHQKRVRILHVAAINSAAATVSVAVRSGGAVTASRDITIPATEYDQPQRQRVTVSALGDSPQVVLTTTSDVRLALIGMSCEVQREPV